MGQGVYEGAMGGGVWGLEVHEEVWRKGRVGGAAVVRRRDHTPGATAKHRCRASEASQQPTTAALHPMIPARRSFDNSAIHLHHHRPPPPTPSRYRAVAASPQLAVPEPWCVEGSGGGGEREGGNYA